MSSQQMKRVAIIGSGAGGLAASKILKEANLESELFEQYENVGGIWRAGGEIVYHGLRCNLPHQIMQFKGFPFLDTDEETSGRSFVTGRQVGNYLERYAQDIPVRFKQRVERAERENNKWRITVRDIEDGDQLKEYVFEALVVANGHYEKPAEIKDVIPGVQTWPGKILHSRDYFEPSPFEGSTVICIGARSSGTDIAKELHRVAKKVIVADKSCTKKLDVYGDDSLIHAPPIARLGSDGSIHFADGSYQKDDTAQVYIISCIGFEYSFPFFSADIVTSKNRAVKPLYLHMFHLDFPESLAFLGLPHSVVPFPLMQAQAHLAAAVISGRVQLPNREARKQAGADYEAALPRLKDAHHLGDKQWNYCLSLLRLAQLSDDEFEQWDKFIRVNQQIYNHVGPRRPQLPGTDDIYRRLEYLVNRQHASWRCLNENDIDTEIEHFVQTYLLCRQ